MEEETTPSPEYLKGFNEGYILAKESPDLAEKLSTVKGDGDRIHGLLDGSKEYSLEKIRDLRPNWLKEKNRSKDREPTKSRDKDRDIE